MRPVVDPPFLATVPLGTRVVVRYRLAGERGTGGGPLANDVIGTLRSRSPDDVEIDSEKHGLVWVRRADIVAAKPVPPQPRRPGGG
jgi:N-acetylglutamate synthase